MAEGKINFLKTKLDLDTGLSKMLPGDSRKILNSIVHASESGNVGDIENIKGNTEQTNAALPGGVLTTVGACKDGANEAIIYFIHGTGGVDAIMRYYVADKSFETILRDNLPAPAAWEYLLEFNPDYPIQAVVVEGNLIWTDGLNPVRQTNIEKAINFTAGAGTPRYTEMKEAMLNLIKVPPFNSPDVVYATDTDFEKNHLRGKLFQFTYRFVYDDWGESVYSDISDVPLPIGSEAWYGEIVRDVSKNNLINIQIQTGNEDVTRMDIIGREGADGAWFRVATIIKEDLDLDDDDFYTHSFYHNQSKEEVSQIEAGELFSYIPPLADSLALLEDNRIILGGITEGEEKEDIAVGFHTFTEDIPAADAGGALQQDYAVAPNITLVSSGTHRVDFKWRLDESVKTYNPPVQGDILKITLHYVEKIYYITAAMAGDFDIYINFIKEKLENDFVSGISVVEVSNDVLDITRDIYIYFKLDIQVYASAAAATVLKYLGFKTGAHHPFCMIYYDETRRTNGAHINDDCVVYIDFPAEQTTRTDTNYKNSIEWRVGHTPPIWATHWQWGYAENSSVSWFVQYPIGIRDMGAGDLGIHIDTDRHVTIIDIEPLNTINDYPAGAVPWHMGSSLEAYVWEKGDRIRFITETPDDLGNGDIGDILVAGGPAAVYIDLEILGVGEAAAPAINTLITEEIAAALVGNAADKINDRSLAEIYRPKKTSDYTIYKTFGQIFGITYPGVANRRHDGVMQNQDSASAIESIESSTDANPIVITITGHPYADSEVVYVEGHTINTNANGFWVVAAAAANTFELAGSTATGAGAGGATGAVRLAAVGNFPGGDVYHILRVFNIDIDTGVAGDHPVMVESQHYSDFYDSDVYSLGRPMVELDEDFRKGTKSSLLRYGGIYIPNTKINNLAKFGYDDYTTKLKIQDGTINQLDFNGEILKVFQTHKKTSIYIGKTALYKADGSQDIVTTDAVIGSIHPGIEDYGTVFPGSVVHHATHTYFYDIYKGEVIRDAYNGMYPISDYDMKKYFSDKSQALLTSGIANINVQAVFDVKYGLYIITFTDSVTPANNDTVAFHEKSNSWISFYNFTPEMYSSFGETTISFKDGLLYTHNDNDVYCNFYGTQYTQEVDIVFNAGLENMKVFKTIAVYSNKKWHAPLSGDITTSPTDLYPTGMSSRLRAPHFLDIEGVFRADFLQNELTSSGSPVARDLVSGEDLRGSAIRVNLKNSETTLVVLKEVEIGFDLSV